MRKIISIIIILLYCKASFAYDYSEHKDIGDMAFTRFLSELSRQGNASLLFQYLGITRNEGDESFYFADLSVNSVEKITYGVLNGLGGDHTKNPLILEEQLRMKNSVLQRILLLHKQYLEAGYTTAPDGKLSQADFGYLLQAAVNLPHFYEYGKTFQQQFRYFNKDFIKQCQNPALMKSVFKELDKTNALNMYVSLHAVAIDLSEQSGRLAKTNPEEARRLFFYAFLFNGFADHFLEDAFASGHLVVNRTILASVTNNRALHNFYNEEGCTVVNREGEIWHAYGDKQFNNTHNAWEKDTILLDVRYSEYTEEADRIIRATCFSLSDIWNAFEGSYSDEKYISFFDKIPNEKSLQADFLIQHISALTLVPIPYNSDLSTLLPDTTSITKDMRKTVQLLYYRNFVRSRIANSFVVGFNNSAFAGRYYDGMDLRLDFGSPVSLYSRNSQGGKKGTADYWLGYTLTYSLGNIRTRDDTTFTPEFIQQVRAGVRNNLDVWVSEKRFLGISNYIEAGVQFTGGEAAFVFVPSLGLQLGSLLNINYYNMSTWLRIPLQYLLPLSLKYGAILSPHSAPVYFSGIDINVVF